MEAGFFIVFLIAVVAGVVWIVKRSSANLPSDVSTPGLSGGSDVGGGDGGPGGVKVLKSIAQNVQDLTVVDNSIPIEWAKPGQTVPSQPGVILRGLKKVAENYPGVPVLFLSPADALALGPINVQSLSYYLYLNSLSPADLSKWLEKFLSLGSAQPESEKTGILQLAGIIIGNEIITVEAWQVLEILSRTFNGEGGGVDFGIDFGIDWSTVK